MQCLVYTRGGQPLTPADHRWADGMPLRPLDADVGSRWQAAFETLGREVVMVVSYGQERRRFWAACGPCAWQWRARGGLRYATWTLDDMDRVAGTLAARLQVHL